MELLEHAHYIAGLWFHVSLFLGYLCVIVRVMVALEDMIQEPSGDPEAGLSVRCDCRGMCVKKCPCKAIGVSCTDNCGCN